ncbi:AraC family transcriptional regulator [Amycolatopsis sulphurea]|uniref:AraC family transcriptional regulator n=1 Tax=Amycolatopsis sulphurea TaxID=76022 RepID=A0A2A9F6Z3_9PSEU|nr:AraC family transcriptional regulator [Amycolatopsis sulphurea]PFG47187.1 AraC family transcriptional regulator [Amycolatopsis sulphurea]
MYTVETLDSAEHAPAERGEWWRDLVSSIHCPMAFTLQDDYIGRIEHQRSDSYQLVRWWGDEEYITRSAADIRKRPHGAYELLVPVRGALTISQNDHTVEVRPAAMTLASLDAKLDLRHGDRFSSLAFVIPQERLDVRLARPVRTGLVLDAGSGLGCIVADLLHSLRKQRLALDGPGFDAVADRIVDVLALACNAGNATAAVTSDDGLLPVVRRFVRAHAHDPGLTGATLAAQLGWSLRHIQAQLQRAGTTPSDLIREERLALSRLRLQDPLWRHQSITQVAYSSGFGDLSTFSNAYRRRFGERPSDTRA